MGYKDPDKQREYQRQWQASRSMAVHDSRLCVDCGATKHLTFGEVVRCRSCLRIRNMAYLKLSKDEKHFKGRKKKAKQTLRRLAKVKFADIDDEVAYLYLLCSRSLKKLRGIKVVDIDIISKEISSPALRQVADMVIKTLNDSVEGRLDYIQANVRLRSCKTIVQIIALERLRPQLPHDGMGYENKSLPSF